MPEWSEIGRIVKLQVQRDRLLKDNLYRTGNLVEVGAIRLNPDGPIGFDGSSWVVDRHHRAHPAAARFDPGRALSIGFTSHYEYMWARFEPVPLGSAGENLIVEADRLVTLPDLAGGIRIDSAGESTVIPTAIVAEPCVPFTRFVTGRAGAAAGELIDDRNCLRRGIRGFVMALDGTDNFEVRPGDRVSIRAG